MRVKMKIRLERPSTGSGLETGITFEVRPGEGRVEHVETAEMLIGQNFPGWRISVMEFV
jgi:hypothetical protein